MSERKTQIYKAAQADLCRDNGYILLKTVRKIGDAIATAQAKIDGAKGGRSGMRSRCKSCRRFVRAGAGDTCEACANEDQA